MAHGCGLLTTDALSPPQWIREGFRAVDLRFAGHVDREGIPLIRFTDDPSVWARNDHFYQGIQGMWNITEPFSRLTLQRSSDSAAPPTVPVQLPMLYISRKGYCHVRPEDLPQGEQGWGASGSKLSNVGE